MYLTGVFPLSLSIIQRAFIPLLHSFTKAPHGSAVGSITQTRVDNIGTWLSLTWGLILRRWVNLTRTSRTSASSNASRRERRASSMTGGISTRSRMCQRKRQLTLARCRLRWWRTLWAYFLKVHLSWIPLWEVEQPGWLVRSLAMTL